MSHSPKAGIVPEALVRARVDTRPAAHAALALWLLAGCGGGAEEAPRDDPGPAATSPAVGAPVPVALAGKFHANLPLSLSSTTNPVSCQWPTLDATPADLNSS